jgi:hypothetical protein
MATPDDDTQTAAPPPAPPPPSSGGAPIDYGALAQQIMQAPPPVQPDTTPVKRGWLSLLGEALGGGHETAAMSPGQSESAGLRALMGFGTGLMAASRYQPGQTAFSNLAGGFQGAQQSERGSEELAVSQLAAQQNYQMEQQKLQMERLKTALPLLRMQAGANIPNLLAGTGAQPGTSTGSGGPATGGTYESAIGGIEGTGKNPNSSAAGTGAFLDSTWKDFAAANPDLFKGMTPQQILDARTDPNLGPVLGNKAITWLAQRNAGQLGGIAPTGQSLGIAHYVGPGAAASIMAAPDNAPVSSFVGGDAVKANPELATMTAGQLKQRYANVPNPGFLKPPGSAPTAQGGGPAPTLFAGPGAPTGGAGAPPAVPLPVPPVPASGGAPAIPGQPPASTIPAPPPAPGTPPRFADFQAQNPITITPAEQASLDSLELAKKQAATELQNAPVTGVDRVKVVDAYNAAAKAVVDAQRQIQNDHTTQQVTLFNKQQELAQAPILKAQEGQQAIDLAQLQAKLKAQENVQTSQLASRAKVLDQLDTDATSAHENLTQLQLVKQLSDAAGQPGILASYPELRSWLTKLDIATPEQTQQWSAQQALEAATNKLTLAQRAGSGMSRVTNMDLQFLQHASPQSFNPQDWRNAQISYLQTLYQRQQQFAGLVHRGVADGMPLTDAQNAADKELGPTIPQRPSVLNGQPLDKTGQARWNFDNLQPGQFYKDEGGTLRIFTPGNTTRP